MVTFIPGGPKRYAHQSRGLKKLLETAGVGALLFDPGLGKTATTLDFCSILALKAPVRDGVQEARVLVVAPLAAIDTWVKQASIWVTPQVDFWAEALGGTGSIIQRAEALAARGGQPYRQTPGSTTKKRKRFRDVGGVRMEEPERAEHWQKALDWNARSSERVVLPSDGPDGLGRSNPRLVLEVINFDTFSSRQRVGSKTTADIVLDGVRRFDPDLIVIDESHKIKGATSNVSRLMDRIGQTVKRRIILTGTVMPAGPLDVFAQWRFLDPYAFGQLQPDGSMKRATMDGFKARYAVLGGYLGHEVVGYRNLDELQRIMSQRAVVARKEDELDLPPVIPIPVPIILSPAEKQAYDQMKKDLSTKLLGGQLTASSNNRLTQMMRLRQITAGHLPDDTGTVHTIGTTKVDAIRSIAHDTLAGVNRIVVFCLFTHELHQIAEKLKEAGTVIMAIGGETPRDERLRYRARFGSNEKTRMILIAQVQTLSLAVNELVTASDVIFGSLSQQRDDLIQAIDRLNRIGQKGEKVRVFFVEAPKTIDEVIHKSHDDRTNLESAVLRHILGEQFDAFAEKEANEGTAEMSDAGAHDETAAPAAVVQAETDGRFPGATSLAPEEVSAAVGNFNGEDEAPFAAPPPDPESWPPSSAFSGMSTQAGDAYDLEADGDDDGILDLTGY